MAAHNCGIIPKTEHNTGLTKAGMFSIIKIMI